MSSHRNGKGSDHKRSKPSGPRTMETKSTDPRSNESQSNGPRPDGTQLMEQRTPGPRDLDLQSTEPWPSGPRTMGPRTMGPQSSDLRLTSDQSQTGASRAGGQNQIEIMRLSEELTRIRWQIEAIYPLKAEQEERVQCQSDEIASMERNKQPSRDKRKAREELGVRETALRETVKKLEQARLEEERVFMRRWRLQHAK